MTRAPGSRVVGIARENVTAVGRALPSAAREPVPAARRRRLFAALSLYAAFMALHVACAWNDGGIVTSLLPGLGSWLGPVDWATYAGFALVVAAFRGWSRTGIARAPARGWAGLCIAPVVAGLPFVLLGYNLDRGSVVPLLVVGVPLVALNEELFFRGVLLDLLRPFGWRRAVLWSAVLFGASHLANLFSGAYLPFTVMQVAATAGGGVMLAAIRIRTGSLWPVLLVHAAVDLVAISTLTGPATASPILLPVLFLWLVANLALWRLGWRMLDGRTPTQLDDLFDGERAPGQAPTAAPA